MKAKMEPAETAPSAMPANPISTNYADIIHRILRVANQHKAGLLLRALVGAAPFLLAVVCIMIVSTVNIPEGQATPTWVIIAIAVMILLLLVTPLWLMTINRVVKIEQVLWVRSFFDGNTEATGNTLRKALSLFFPTVRLSFGVFLRYYWIFWLAVAAGIAALAYAFYLNYNSIPSDREPDFGLIMLGIFSPAIIIIAYFLVSKFVDVKTRYLLIILADTYGQPGFSYTQVFAENKRLAALDKANGTSMAELLAVSMGTGVAINTAASAASGTALAASSYSGRAGRGVAALANIYGAEVISLTESLAQTVIFYTHYRAVLAGDISRQHALSSPPV